MITLLLGKLSSLSNSNATFHHRYLLVFLCEKRYYAVYFLGLIYFYQFSDPCYSLSTLPAAPLYLLTYMLFEIFSLCFCWFVCLFSFSE